MSQLKLRLLIIDQVTQDDRLEEMIYSRILFLLTYNKQFNFDVLFDEHSLAESLCHVCWDDHVNF